MREVPLSISEYDFVLNPINENLVSIKKREKVNRIIYKSHEINDKYKLETRSTWCL